MSDFKEICKALGKSRLDKLGHIESKDDWDRARTQRKHTFDFTLSDARKQWLEYHVADFEAELGFFTDILGLSAQSLSKDYAVVQGESCEFYIGFWRASGDKLETPVGSISICFFFEDIYTGVDELKKRGVEFTSDVKPFPDENGTCRLAKFQTPNGHTVELWGFEESLAE